MCFYFLESAKLWNIRNKQCIKTFQIEKVLCGVFAPGDRCVLFGTKDGILYLFDVSTSLLIDHVQAHNGPINCITLKPDKMGFITASGDKQIKIWDFELITHEVGEDVS
jgi:U3 small nucleolar RNA-associated protein 12